MLSKETILKLKNKKKLAEKNIKSLTLGYKHIDKIENEQHRRQQEVSTIIEIANKYFGVDWMRSLTEYQENGY